MKKNKNWRELISQPKYGIKMERNVWVPMRDGVRLSVDVFRPDARGKFPVLLAQSAYGKEEEELLLPPQPLTKSAIWDGNIEAGDTTDIVPRGYVHIICDVRGSGHSEGEYYSGYTPQEGRDGYDLVEWAAQQPWCDGNVSFVGYSYFSKSTLKVAIEQPPHLKTLFVSHVDPDHYRDSNYHGGVLSLFSYGIWDGRHGTSGFAPNHAFSDAAKHMPKEEFERVRQELLNHPDIRHYPNVFHLLNYPQKNPRFFDILMHPYDGPWWWERSAYPFFDKIKVPMYVVGKSAHEGAGYWKLYCGINVPKKLLVKPNGPEERPWREDLELLIRWYDHWLKGNDTGIMDEPPIQLYVMGENKYRFADEWPLPGTEWLKCYPRRWEGLLFEPELYQPEPDCFLQQPLHVSNKRDSVKYISPPVPEPLEVIGSASMHLFATIDQDDTNWIVKVFDVGPGGSQERVAKGFLKASHRTLDPEKSEPYAPWHPHIKESTETIRPGEMYEYDIGLGVINNVFLPGHRIKLEIESLESPRDPEMQIHYHPHLNSSKTTLHKIYRDREHQSYLLLPIVNKKESIIQQLSDDNFL